MKRTQRHLLVFDCICYFILFSVFLLQVLSIFYEQLVNTVNFLCCLLAVLLSFYSAITYVLVKRVQNDMKIEWKNQKNWMLILQFIGLFLYGIAAVPVYITWSRLLNQVEYVYEKAEPTERDYLTLQKYTTEN